MKLELPRVHPIKLADFEARDDELAAAKANRTLVEYYFTCTPSLPLYVLDRFPGIERIFYIDADFYFFSPATALLDDWGQGSIYLVAHRFPDSLRERERFGKFNVGILGWRDDPEGRRCLSHWRQQCIAWCYDRLEDGRFADQKYLDEWPQRFGGVVVSQHSGVNVAPWNKERYVLQEINGLPCVNGQPIVCYHFHSVKLHRLGLVEPQVEDYGGSLSRAWIRLVYQPYLQELLQAEQATNISNGADLRTRRALSLLDVTARGPRAQLLLRVGDRWIEVPPCLLRPMRLLRRTAARLRDLASS
jgi:hypothetical protein